MAYVLSLAILASLTVSWAAAMPHYFGGPPPALSLPDDFTANITLNMSGQVLHGYMYHDTTGQRTYTHLEELSQYVYVFQPFNLATTTTYTITTSGCTCQITQGGIVKSFFAELVTAVKKGSCAGGTMYENAAFANLDSAPHKAYCIDGSNTPIAGGHTTEWYTFKNFAAGRDKPFPYEPLQSMIDTCNQACLG